MPNSWLQGTSLCGAHLWLSVRVNKLGKVMDCKTFIVQMVDTLAWPVLILTIIFFFKDQFKNLINSVSELKVGNSAVSFSKKMVASTITKKSTSETSITAEPAMTEEEILNIPDDDYEFMQKVANNKSFMPTNESEKFKYNSLVNNGFFEKKEDEVYEPTKKGREIIDVLKSIYY